MSNPDVPFPDPIDFAALGRLDAAATPGPWSRFHDDSPGHTCKCGQIWSEHELLFSPDRSDNYPVDRVDDGRLIVAMRNALPDLLAVVRELADVNTPRNGDLWHEDDGCALWFAEPIDEPPYCGSPLDSEFPWWSTPRAKLSWVPLPQLFKRGSAALASFRNVGGAS